MDSDKSKKVLFSGLGKIMPQEETLEIQRHKKSITIGIPKEIAFQENRVALVPKAVGLLAQNGHNIIVETNAGKSAHFADNEFSESGATIVYTPEDVYKKSDIILKIAPPSVKEIELLKTRQTIISALNLTGQSDIYFKKLISKKITAITFEYIKDKTGEFAVRRSMSEIVGTTSILIAANYLSDINYGKGSMLGGFSGITPTAVVILGAGTVAEYAARAALGLGAQVKIFDNSIYKLRRIQNLLNKRVFTSIIQPRVLIKALKSADVVIGAIHSSEGRSPCVVSEDMVKEMKNSSVIIDVSIDQGGCFETSHITNHTKPVFKKYGVTHYCVPNISSMVPHTVSYALSNFFAPVFLKMGEEGGMENLIKYDKGIRQGVYLYNGILTSKYIGKYFNIPYQNIELLIDIFH